MSAATRKARRQKRIDQKKAAAKTKAYKKEHPHNVENVANAIKSRKAAYEKELAKMGK